MGMYSPLFVLMVLCISSIYAFKVFEELDHAFEELDHAKYKLKACASPLAHADVFPGYCAFMWYNPGGQPREVKIASNNDVLYVDASSSTVKVLWEANGKVNSANLASASGLNHGLYIHGGYLYASSPTTVYRWSYKAGDRSSLGTATVVIKDVICCHHTSRTLEFDASGLLYVQSGSGSNVDPDTTHGMIRTYQLPDNITAGGIEWSSGKIFAYGLRNEVGLRFDAQGVLWGVENGRDDLSRPDLGGDIHLNNPSEEMNKFTTSGRFYGYPYCWSEFNLPLNKSHPIGTQWADPGFYKDGTHTDEWCQTASNVQTPAYNFQAHMAPLDIIFYNGAGSFPGVQKGDAFVSFHGSWDRQPPVGYKVSLVTFQNGNPVKDTNFLAYAGPGATGPNWPYRPVSLAFYKCGGTVDCLLVTSDSGSIIALVPN